MQVLIIKKKKKEVPNLIIFFVIFQISIFVIMIFKAIYDVFWNEKLISNHLIIKEDNIYDNVDAKEIELVTLEMKEINK